MDFTKVRKTVKKLHIPKEYWGIDFDALEKYQWNIYLSIRETAGKTTQGLLLGCILRETDPEHYGAIEYIRNDESQLTRGNVEALFDTVVHFDYVRKITHGRWDTVKYHSQQKKFYYAKTDEDGTIIEEDKEPICVLHSLQRVYDYKSVYNAPKGNYILFDEFVDTSRSTYGIFVELLNAVSTIGRPMSPGRAEYLKIILMGNNTSEYSFWFDEFGLSDQIPYLKFGGAITFNTEYGTTGICKLLEVGEVQKQRLRERNIPFLGFPGKKAAAFTGATEWSGKVYRHPDFDLDYQYCIFRRAYVKHRNRYIQLNIFYDDIRGYYLFCHFSNKPLLDDNLIFTIEPEKQTDIYGFGKYVTKDKILRVCKEIVYLYKENRCYFSSNSVGSLLEDFIKNIK